MSLGSPSEDLLKAIATKYEDAFAHSGWVLNGQSANYQFGSAGDGDRIYVSAATRGPIRVLDFGCGRGDFLCNLAESAHFQGAPDTSEPCLFGVTGGWRSEVHPKASVSTSAALNASATIHDSPKVVEIIKRLEEQNIHVHPPEEAAKLSIFSPLIEIGFPMEYMSHLTHFRNYSCVKRIDLVLSSWTFLHLADPLGTLKDLYDHFLADGGMIVANHFYADISDTGGVSLLKALFAILRLQGYEVGFEEEVVEGSSDVDDTEVTTVHICIRKTRQKPALEMPVRKVGVTSRCWHIVQPQYCIFNYDWDQEILEGSPQSSRIIELVRIGQHGCNDIELPNLNDVCHKCE
eukprot:gene21637-26026_t